MDPDGPQPVHPRGCPGDGVCLHCLAIEHWQKCQALKRQRPPEPARVDEQRERRPKREREPEPAQGTRWKRRRRRLFASGGGEP